MIVTRESVAQNTSASADFLTEIILSSLLQAAKCPLFAYVLRYSYPSSIRKTRLDLWQRHNLVRRTTAFTTAMGTAVATAVETVVATAVKTVVTTAVGTAVRTAVGTA